MIYGARNREEDEETGKVSSPSAPAGSVQTPSTGVTAATPKNVTSPTVTATKTGASGYDPALGDDAAGTKSTYTPKRESQIEAAHVKSNRKRNKAFQ